MIKVNNVASYVEEHTEGRDRINSLSRGRIIGQRVSTALPIVRLKPSSALHIRNDFEVSCSPFSLWLKESVLT